MLFCGVPYGFVKTLTLSRGHTIYLALPYGGNQEARAIAALGFNAFHTFAEAESAVRQIAEYEGLCLATC